MPPNEDLKELIRLTKDNNRMLHSMRRNAFWGGILKLVIYVALFVAVPFWLYATYLGPMMDQMMETYRSIQGTGAKAEAQFGNIQGMIEQFKNKFSPQE